MDEQKVIQGKGIQRCPITMERDCSLGVISFKDCTWSDHLVKIVDFSVIGIGIESDQPIEPGIIWFKENLYGHKCGSLVWRKKNGVRYRAGIQFISLTREQEKYLQLQIEQMRHFKRVQDPERIIAMLMAYIKKDADRFVNSP